MLLEVSGLACRRADRLVFTGIGFGLEAGGALVVSGRNGAGKSTLLAVLAGLLRPETGRISLRPAAELRSAVHLLGHRDAIKAQLTPAENLRFAAAMLGSAGGLPVATALDRVGLAGAADLPASYLSAGQRRRLALARLLVAPRPLWLLDEPTGALDDQGQAVLETLMAEHRAGGSLIVAATHAPLPLPAAGTLLLERQGAAAA